MRSLRSRAPMSDLACQRRTSAALALLAGLLCLLLIVGVRPQDAEGRAQSGGADVAVPRFPLRADRHQLDRPTHDVAVLGVIGRRAALFGYEDRSIEALVESVKFVDAFCLSVR